MVRADRLDERDDPVRARSRVRRHQVGSHDEIRVIAMVTLLLMHGWQRINARGGDRAVARFLRRQRAGYSRSSPAAASTSTGRRAASSRTTVRARPGARHDPAADVVRAAARAETDLSLGHPRRDRADCIRDPVHAVARRRSSRSAMSAFLWFKSPKKFWTGLLIVVRAACAVRVHAERVARAHEHDRDLSGRRLGDGPHQRLVVRLQPRQGPPAGRRRLRHLQPGAVPALRAGSGRFSRRAQHLLRDARRALASSVSCCSSRSRSPRSPPRRA